ncbi:MAG: RDD family protein [Planctomycetota bacterium]
MEIVCKRAALRVLAAAAVLASAPPGRAQVLPTRYRKPVAVATADHLYLFVQTVKAQKQTITCRRREGDRWVTVAELHGDYTAIIWHDGHFYMFLERRVVKLEDETWRKVGEAEWPYNWTAGAAAVRDGSLTAFCVDHDGGLLRAYAPLADPGKTDGLLAADWRREPLYEPGAGAPGRVGVRALPVGDACWVFWAVERRPGGAQVLQAARLTRDGLGEWDKVAVSDGRLGFAVAEHGGRALVIFGTLPARLRNDRRLAYRRRGDDKWPPFVSVEPVTNTPLERTVDLAAASFEGSVYLFLGVELLGTEGRILVSRFDGERWTEPVSVVSAPGVDWVVQNVSLIAAVLVACLVLFAVSLVRSWSRPHRAEIAGLEYRLASWWRRAAAYLIDLLVIAAVLLALHAYAGLSVPAELLAAFFVIELLYFSVFEARAGRTFGKRVLGLIVISRNGGYPSGPEALLRNLVRAADTWPATAIVGSTCILNSRGSQRLGDMLAGTYVVREQGE